MNKRFLKAILWSLPLVIVTTAMSGLVYVAVQQNYRQSANDPQIQLAEDGAYALSIGRSMSEVVPKEVIDISKSLVPFIIVYTEDGQVASSSGILDGQAPSLPAGVLNYAKTYGENRLTWQPKAGVRSATVVVHYQGSQPGYILAGRNLREVEVREDQLTKYVGGIWVLTLLLIFCYYILYAPARLHHN